MLCIIYNGQSSVLLTLFVVTFQQVYCVTIIRCSDGNFEPNPLTNGVLCPYPPYGQSTLQHTHIQPWPFPQTQLGPLHGQSLLPHHIATA